MVPPCLFESPDTPSRASRTHVRTRTSASGRPIRRHCGVTDHRDVLAQGRPAGRGHPGHECVVRLSLRMHLPSSQAGQTDLMIHGGDNTIERYVLQSCTERGVLKAWLATDGDVEKAIAPTLTHAADSGSFPRFAPRLETGRPGDRLAPYDRPCWAMSGPSDAGPWRGGSSARSLLDDQRSFPNPRISPLCPTSAEVGAIVTP